jgi:acyl dehydratase
LIISVINLWKGKKGNGMEHASKSLFFEDFQQGDKFYTKTRTITETDIISFAGLSGDYTLIHTDKEFAAQTPHKGIIAHGLLCMAIVSGLVARLGFGEDTAIALRNIDWKFSLPVYPGDTVNAVLNVTKTKALPKNEGGMVDFFIETFNQEGKKVQSGNWRSIFKSKK